MMKYKQNKGADLLINLVYAHQNWEPTRRPKQIFPCSVQFQIFGSTLL